MSAARGRGRLRRSDCSARGNRPGPSRQGVRLPRRRRSAGRGRGDARADRRARDPARLAGGLGLPGPLRPHPGHRGRRRRPHAVPLPRALAAAGGGAQVRVDARVRRRAAQAATRRQEGPGPRGDAARACPGLRREAARPRLLPDRRRGLRGGERELRAGDDPPRARLDRGRRARLRLPGQERAAAGAVGARPRRPPGDRSDAAPSQRARRPARLPRGRRVARRPL